MSTRSFIIVKHQDGRYMGQYCHNDGYPEHVGTTLVEHYNSQELAERLSGLGNLSVLDRQLDPLPEAPNRRSYGKDPKPMLRADQHHFNSPQEGVTIAYGRDRGEKDQQSQDVTHGHLPDMDQEYEYLWDDGWTYRKVGMARHNLTDLPWIAIPAKVTEKA